MTSADQLEQTYRRIYRRLTVGMFIAYAVVIGVAVTVLASGSVGWWWPDRTAAASHAGTTRVEATLTRP